MVWRACSIVLIAVAMASCSPENAGTTESGTTGPEPVPCVDPNVELPPEGSPCDGSVEMCGGECGGVSCFQGVWTRYEFFPCGTEITMTDSSTTGTDTDTDTETDTDTDTETESDTEDTDTQ